MGALQVIPIIISALSLVVSICFSIITLRTQYNARKSQTRIQVFIDYSKRFSDLLRNKPNYIVNGNNVEFYEYMNSYFDFCQEIYLLWKGGNIADSFFQVFKENMQTIMNDVWCKTAWKTREKKYNNDFCTFFQHEIIDWKKNMVKK